MTTPESNESEGWTVFRLPRSHWHCHLTNFQWEGVQPPSFKKRVETFLEELTAGGAPHLVLTGRPGIGKSHIGVAIYRAATVVYGTGLVTWLNVPVFCEAVKRSYGPGEVDPWQDVQGARCLVVLDDLFGRDLTQHEVSQIVYRLIDTAYQNNAAVCVNMNQSVQELQARLASHEISRLLASSTIIPVESTKDWRQK